MKRTLFAALVILMLTGCSTHYETLPNKHVDLKVRSVFVDIDYNSRVVECPENTINFKEKDNERSD